MNKLSIITICYNSPDLERTCESIVNQSFQDFEWIVIDGGSNEQTQKIWDKYKYRINKFISEKDNGIYDACNKGLKLAGGEYINFLNAGDYYDNEKALEEVMSYGLDKDIIYGNLKLLNEKDITIKTYPDKVTNSYLIVDSLPCPATFIKRTLFEKYGNFDTNYKIVSDWEKWIVFICINKCSYKHIPVIPSIFDLTGISSSNQELNNAERKTVIEKYFTKKEIENAFIVLPAFSFFEKIFSVKNSKDKKYKIITILNKHIKIRRRKYEK